MGKSYFWQDLLFSGAKNENFTMAPMATFYFVMLSEACHWRSRKLLGVHVAQVVLTNAHLGFWGTIPIFYRGGEQLFDKIRNWRLTTPQLEGIWKIKKISVNPNSVGVS